MWHISVPNANRALSQVEVVPATGEGLTEALHVLETFLRGRHPVSSYFVERFKSTVAVGDLDVLVARLETRTVGVLVLAFRPNVALGADFASIEDLYVSPEARRSGVGRALLAAAGERCAARGVSYVEAQVEDEEAAAFYAAVGYEVEPDVRVLSLSLTVGRKL